MKTEVTIDDITQTAKLAGLRLTDGEKSALCDHLEKQLISFGVLDSVDADVEPMFDVFGGDTYRVSPKAVDNE